jgi:hypothetical protein
MTPDDRRIPRADTTSEERTMKKKFLLIILTGLWMSGCAHGGAMARCEREPNIDVDLSKPEIDVGTSNRCANPGEIIVIKFKQKDLETGSVMIEPKRTNRDFDESDNWLRRANSENAMYITILVPDDDYIEKYCDDPRGRKCTFEYSIEGGGKVLDPRITVRR